jgi:hypothetical protein
LKQKSVLEFEGFLDVVEKPLASKDLLKFISQFSELRCERCLIFEWILLLEIQNLGLEGKFS